MLLTILISLGDAGEAREVLDTMLARGMKLTERTLNVLVRGFVQSDSLTRNVFFPSDVAFAYNPFHPNLPIPPLLKFHQRVSVQRMLTRQTRNRCDGTVHTTISTVSWFSV